MKRGKRGPWVAAERAVHGRPRPAPDRLADLDHHPPHRGRRCSPAPPPTKAARSAAARRRRSRGRRRRPSGARRAAKRSLWRTRIQVSARWGSMNQAQWTIVSTRSSALGSPGRDSPRCSRTVGSSPPPIARSIADRVAHAEAAAQRLGVVVGKLVGDRERPHLKREQRRVARLACAGRRIASATGAAAIDATVTAGCMRSRRRTSGTANPATSAAPAPARTAVENRERRRRRGEVLKARRVYGRADGAKELADSRAERSRSPVPAGSSAARSAAGSPPTARA